MRGIISWIVFFSAGVLCAGAYFYRLHPEHQPETDLPRVRQELDEAIDRGKRLKRAWDGNEPPAVVPAPATDKPPEAPAAPARPPEAGLPDRPARQSRVGK